MLYTCLGQVLEHRRASDTALGPHSPTAPIGAHRKTLAEILAKHIALAQDLGLPVRRSHNRFLVSLWPTAALARNTQLRGLTAASCFTTHTLVRRSTGRTRPPAGG